MTDALELDALWEEFHRLVNMTSPELAAWLRVREEQAERTGHPAGTTSETETETAAETETGTETAAETGTETGELVLAILQKRRMDLTDDDARVMYRVVDAVEEITERAQAAPGTEAEQDARRQSLMALGHDPLRASGQSTGSSA